MVLSSIFLTKTNFSKVPPLQNTFVTAHLPQSLFFPRNLLRWKRNFFQRIFLISSECLHFYNIFLKELFWSSKISVIIRFNPHEISWTIFYSKKFHFRAQKILHENGRHQTKRDWSSVQSVTASIISNFGRFSKFMQFWKIVAIFCKSAIYEIYLKNFTILAIFRQFLKFLIFGLWQFHLK